jgi:hypothetical protein
MSEPEPRRRRFSATVAVPAAALAGAAALALVTVQSGHRVTFLVVPLGALLGVLSARSGRSRSAAPAIRAAVALVLAALLADFAATVWGLRQLGVPIESALRNPRGVTQFLIDNVWQPRDWLLIGTGAVVAAALAWPRGDGAGRTPARD